MCFTGIDWNAGLYSGNYFFITGLPKPGEIKNIKEIKINLFSKKNCLYQKIKIKSFFSENKNKFGLIFIFN